MKKILPILLVSALLLSGCNGGKGGSSAKSSSSEAASTTAAADTTAENTTSAGSDTTTAATDTTSAVTAEPATAAENSTAAKSTDPDTEALLEAGIVPPEADEPVQPDITISPDAPDDDGPIELPVIPIT
ncbi:MAG: membrane lipoprotein lipid attachment site-containing protein [Ruminococcus sp.]|nr:membrane lipoprotein lipid attachment site-containing protein [Ruminococcus sp.]